MDATGAPSAPAALPASATAAAAAAAAAAAPPGPPRLSASSSWKSAGGVADAPADGMATAVEPSPQELAAAGTLAFVQAYGCDATDGALEMSLFADQTTAGTGWNVPAVAAAPSAAPIGTAASSPAPAPASAPAPAPGGAFSAAPPAEVSAYAMPSSAMVSPGVYAENPADLYGAVDPSMLRRNPASSTAATSTPASTAAAPAPSAPLLAAAPPPRSQMYAVHSRHPELYGRVDGDGVASRTGSGSGSGSGVGGGVGGGGAGGVSHLGVITDGDLDDDAGAYGRVDDGALGHDTNPVWGEDDDDYGAPLGAPGGGWSAAGWMMSPSGQSMASTPSLRRAASSEGVHPSTVASRLTAPLDMIPRRQSLPSLPRM